MYLSIHFYHSTLILIQSYVYTDVMSLFSDNLPDALRSSTLI